MSRTRRTGSEEAPSRSRTRGSRSSQGLLALGAAALFGLVVGVAVMFALPERAPQTGPSARAAQEEAYSNGGAAGYLAPGAVQPLRLLPAPPAAGSARDVADRQIFLATRKLSGSPRWKLAQADSDQSVAATLKTFSCAAGVDLGPASAPATDALLERFARDQAPVIEAAKAGFKRSRPFLSYPGEICIARTDALERSPDYPSGHAAWGWAVALLLAEASPEQGDKLLARGRAYGESRVICGAHNASAVEAGRLVGAAMVAGVHTSPTFRSDLATARIELASLRRSGRQPAASLCAAEASLADPSPF